MSDQPFSYRTIQEESESIVKVRGSKFLGYARPVHSRGEAEVFLSDIQSMHPKARHHCYAWRIGHPDPEECANDDGEPSGTAGQPILGQLLKSELTNVMIIVVRYFGGTLLGTSGLIKAYKSCAELVLKNARIIRVIENEVWCIEVDFAIVHLLEEWAPKIGFDILDREHQGTRMIYRMEIEKGNSESGRKELIAKLMDIYPAEVDVSQVDYEGLRIKICDEK